MAPEKKLYKGKFIGGKISDVSTLPSGLRILRPRKINTPRFSAIDRNDLIRQVEENSVMIEETLDLYLEDISPILFVNDLSLYFQSGKYQKAFQAMEESETFVGNAYYGEYLEDDLGSGISFKERELVQSFSSKTDLLIHL
jgi:hypothetical protein